MPALAHFLREHGDEDFVGPEWLMHSRTAPMLSGSPLTIIISRVAVSGLKTPVSLFNGRQVTTFQEHFADRRGQARRQRCAGGIDQIKE